MEDDARERAEQRTLLMPRRDQGSELRPGHALQEFVIDKLLGDGLPPAARFSAMGGKKRLSLCQSA